MATKTFRADTILDALQQVQAEFGPEAIVVSVREVPGGPAWQVWRRPGCEVIATTPNDPLKPAPKGTSTARKDELPEGIEWIEEPLDKPGKAKSGVVRSEVQAPTPEKKKPAAKVAVPWAPPKLYRYDEDLLMNPRHDGGAEFAPEPAPKTAPVVRAAPVKEEAVPQALAAHLDTLARSGLDEMLLERVRQVSLEAAGPAILEDEKRCRDYLKRQLEAFIRETPKNHIDSPARILCMIGPSGSGKTSACARLAAYYTRKGKRVAWINADTVRAGAVAEARSYAEALNIPLYLAYLPEDIPGQIAAEPKADVILVDTPAFSPYNEAQMAELGAFLAQMPKRGTFLMAAATMKENDLKQTLAAIRLFNIDGMVATKFDETGSLGSIYNFAWHSQLPLTFFSKGKGIVDDFAPATCTELVSELFKRGNRA